MSTRGRNDDERNDDEDSLEDSLDDPAPTVCGMCGVRAPRPGFTACGQCA